MKKYEQRASARVKFSRIDVSYVNLVRLSVRFRTFHVHRTVAYTVTIPVVPETTARVHISSIT